MGRERRATGIRSHPDRPAIRLATETLNRLKAPSSRTAAVAHEITSSDGGVRLSVEPRLALIREKSHAGECRPGCGESIRSGHEALEAALAAFDGARARGDTAKRIAGPSWGPDRPEGRRRGDLEAPSPRQPRSPARVAAIPRLRPASAARCAGPCCGADAARAASRRRAKRLGRPRIAIAPPPEVRKVVRCKPSCPSAIPILARG
jgi:hypothetical protein